MRSFLVLAAGLSLVSVPVLAQAQAQAAMTAASLPANVKGQMLRTADNARLGRVSRVSDNGAVEVIVDTQVRLIPAASLAMVDGKLTTSLTKQQVVSLR